MSCAVRFIQHNLFFTGCATSQPCHQAPALWLNAFYSIQRLRLQESRSSNIISLIYQVKAHYHAGAWERLINSLRSNCVTAGLVKYVSLFNELVN